MADVQELAVVAMRAKGAADAADLRQRAGELDGTGIIAEEYKIPVFDPNKDYSAWPAGSPVYETVNGARQVYKLITPHNAASYPGSTPSNTPALWSVCHTKDPALAKPWLAPNGQSGLYAVDECCTENGHVWKNTYEDNEFSPSALPERWEDLGATEEVQA